MSETSLRVPDMTCDHCKAVIERALGPLPGVTAVTVDLDAKLVQVEHDRERTAVAGLRSAVEDQGYEVTGWDPR
jgi:copper chaperone